MSYFEEEFFSRENPLLIIKGAEFYDCTFEDLDFSLLDCQFSKFIECKFLKCNLSNVNLNQSTLRDCHFSGCKLMGINWTLMSNFSANIFSECIFDLSVFSGMNIKNGQFLDSRIHNVDFSDCLLEAALFKGSDLKKSHFNGANLYKADLREAKNYTIDMAFTKIRKAKFSFPEAISLLQVQDIIIEGI